MITNNIKVVYKYTEAPFSLKITESLSFSVTVPGLATQHRTSQFLTTY